MPYAKSAARKNLESNLKDIRKVLNKTKSSKINSEIKEYVIASSVFLSHAELENYISDVFSALAVGINAEKFSGSKLPPNLHCYLFFLKSNIKNTVGKLISDGSERTFIAQFSHSINYSKSIISDHGLLIEIKGSDICLGVKYPSVENLRTLFYRIGINDIFVEVNKQLKLDSKLTFEEFGGIRTSLGHSATLPGISNEDINNKIIVVEKIFSTIDRIIYINMCLHFRENFWVKYLKFRF